MHVIKNVVETKINIIMNNTKLSVLCDVALNKIDVAANATMLI